MSWINSMMSLVSSDELATDVTGAEALLERHQVCIDFDLQNNRCLKQRRAPEKNFLRGPLEAVIH
jgi:hypothetical protein